MTRAEQIKYFREVMVSTEREGIEDLLDFMQELGFYDAPASGGNHCCKDGGLLEHTVNVMQYYFYTQNSGKDTVKSPIGMFPAYAIDNDLNYVADKIRNFYEMGDYKTDAEMERADRDVSSDLEKPEGRSRRTRGKKADPVPEEAPEEKTGRTRKSRSEVQAENEQNKGKGQADVLSSV